MTKGRTPRLHQRLLGLMKVMRRMIDERDAPDHHISKRERSDLKYIYSRLEMMLADDRKDIAKIRETKECGAHPRYCLNTECDFFDLDANRIQCAIGSDLYHCGKNCLYATNVPGTLPPYGTKYMKGGYL